MAEPSNPSKAIVAFSRRMAPTILIALAALVASLSRFIRGVSCGHDFTFHIVSWLEVQRSWSHGVWYPHWAQTPNWGTGEPRFVFYPPLTWLIGAALGNLLDWQHYSHWKVIPAVLIYCCFFGSGLAVRALARQFLPPANATLAGVIATAAPYALFTAYERTAFSELAAAVWIPLLLRYALRPPPAPSPKVPKSLSPDSPLPTPSSLVPTPYSLVPQSLVPQSRVRQSLSPESLPLAVLLALTWLTNAPAGVIASYLLAFAAVSAAILYRAWWPIFRAALGGILGLGLAAFYLIPAAYEQRWIAIRQAVDVGMRVSDSWLFARHAAPDLELHDQVLRMASAIVVFTAAAALVTLLICLRRGKLAKISRPFWLPLAILIPILFLLQLPISAPIWTHVPKLEFLQFPWRWLMVLGIPYAIFLAAATPLNRTWPRRISIAAWIIILLVFSAGASLIFFQNCDAEDQTGSQVDTFTAGSGVEGTDEYASLGSDNSLVASGLPDACLVSDPTQTLGESDSGPEGAMAPVWYDEQGSCDDTFHARLWQNEHKTLAIEADHPGFLILRLRRYPAWKIAINGQPPATMPLRDDGLIVLPVPAGVSSIDIRWAITPDAIVGRAISLLSALAFLIAFSLWLINLLRNRARTRPRLSS